MAIFLYANCVVIAGAVLFASYAVAAVKGFAGAYYKDEEDITESVVYHKDKEGKQRRKELVASPVKVKLRQLQRDTVIISLSLISVSASLFFV
jgi:hypothetical protein